MTTTAEYALVAANHNGRQTCIAATGTPTFIHANAVVNDGAPADATDSNYYLATYPYLAPALPGAPNAVSQVRANFPLRRNRSRRLSTMETDHENRILGHNASCWSHSGSLPP